MQARNLSVGEVSLSSSSSSPVVKVLLDVPSQSSALLLADSSCLLFSSPLSGKSSSSPPFIIPPQCSDICFLRLRERNSSKSNTISASSSSSGKLSTRSEARNAPNAVKTRNSAEEIAYEEVQVPNGLKTKTFEEEKLPEQRKHSEEEIKACEEREPIDEKKKVVCEARRNPFEEGKKHLEENKKFFQERRLSEEEKKKKSRAASDKYGAISTGKSTDSETNELMFLVAKPEMGGSGTDVVGWKCNGSQFTQTSLSLEDHKGGNPCSSYGLVSAARFHDIPHGSFIGISASVNVIVLYSPTLAKVWILSAKLVGGQDLDHFRNSKSVGQDQDFDRNDVLKQVQGQNQSRGNAKDGDILQEDSQYPLCESVNHGSNGQLMSLAAQFSRSIPVQDKDHARNAKPLYLSAEDSLKDLQTTKRERTNRKLQGNQFLQLVKCAVVDCHGPIYDLYLSLQYLLVGQLGGVRVWRLRPLVKGKITLMKKKNVSLVRANGQSKEQHNDNSVITQQERNKIVEMHEIVSKKGGSLRNSFDHDSTVVQDMGYQMEINKRELTPLRPKNGIHVVNLLKNGFVDLKSSKIADFPDNSNYQGSQICNCNKDTSVQAMIDPNLEDVQTVKNVNVVADASRVEQGDFDQEEPNGQQRTSQCSVFSSSSSASSSGPVFCSTTHGTGAQSLPTSSQIETACAFEKDESAMGAQGEVFVPFHNQIVLKKASEQVVSICSLSGKEYLILDSEGKLHLLVLQNYHRGVERMILQQQIPQAPLDAFMQPLPCAIKIKTLAVLPLASTGENPPASASRVFWVSDGSHTLYAMLIPAREMPKGVSEDHHLQLGHNPTVIQTVFTTDRVCSLSALSVNAVLVQTEGRMFTYFLSGA